MEAKLFDKHPDRFNRYVASHPAGDLLQTTYWGELKSPIQDGSLLPIAVVESGQIRASAMILKRKVPMLGRCIFIHLEDRFFLSTALEHLLEAVRDSAKTHGALFWKMNAHSKKVTLLGLEFSQN